MSRRRVYQQATLDVQRRFFDTVTELVASGVIIGGVAGYCNTAKIENSHYYAQRKDPQRGFFEIAWVMPLITIYGISPAWMLLGSGKKYKKQILTNTINNEENINYHNAAVADGTRDDIV